MNFFPLIAFLGNPGREYAKTRHNAGFMAADYLYKSLISGYAWKDWRGLGLYTIWEHSGGKSYILKPQTYMNLSGNAVLSLASFYKIAASQILIVYDDLALPFGAIRLRRSGSDGAHRGMRSIINSFSTSLIARLRIGIGEKPSYMQGKDYVLGNFSAHELAELPKILENIKQTLLLCVECGIEKALSCYIH